MEVVHGECGFCKRPGAYRCIADITRIIPQSHSSVGTFLSCHYLYYLQKILGIEVRPPFLSNALKAGKLWDCQKQFHLGVKEIHDHGVVYKNAWDVINHYEIDPMVVAKVRALYKAYKELEIEVDPGYELQEAVNLDYNITLTSSSFIPSINIGKEAINLWDERKNQEESKDSWTFPLKVNGFYDRKYSNYFTEDKLSGRPEFYLDPFYVDSQCSTYFLANPELEYCILEVVRFPQQREYKKKEETPEEMFKRTYDDILSRPSKYFIDYNKEKRRYGRKFYRGEFQLDAAVERFKQVTIEILAARWRNGFYRNFKACSNLYPGIQCDYQNICRTGNISDTMYQIREK